MNPVVSVIIPVYNADSTISRCVDSILNQTYKDLEILLVDDGSTDASKDVCRELELRDIRVRFIEKEHSGVSDSRNIGIRAARGRYLQFADADDWLSQDATGLMVQSMEEADAALVVAGFYRVVGQNVSRKGKRFKQKILSKTEYAEKMLKSPADFYYGVLWNKLYRRDIIEKSDLYMDPFISWCEDFIFNLEYLRFADSICPLSSPVYYYTKTEDSLVSQGMSLSNTVRMKREVLRHYIDFYKQIYDEDTYAKKRAEIYSFILDVAGDGSAIPMMPGTMKLGEERSYIPKDLTLRENALSDMYYRRMQLRQSIETIALKHDLTPEMVLVFLGVISICGKKDIRSICEITNLAPSKVRSEIRKLMALDLISRPTKQSGYIPGPASAGIRQDCSLYFF